MAPTRDVRAASCDRDASRVRPSRDARGSPVRRDGRAETLTWRANRRPINGLANACAGYPQACQHNLCVSAAMRTSCSAGLAAWHRDANCGEAVHNAARLAQRLHHTCQSLSDQGLSVAVRRISTSLPTFSVEKCMWRSCGAVSAARRFTACKCPSARLSGTTAAVVSRWRLIETSRSTIRSHR